jgi:hypothetical protein
MDNFDQNLTLTHDHQADNYSWGDITATIIWQAGACVTCGKQVTRKVIDGQVFTEWTAS